MPPFTLGRVIALLVFIASFVLLLLGRLGLEQGIIDMALALALLVP